MKRILLEVCVDDIAGLHAAVRGGADRIELCAALALGGLTPSAGLIRAAAGSGVPVMAMIRPRAGDFVWDAAELEAQLTEIGAMRAAGLAGVVIGASQPDGQLDAAALARLRLAAGTMDVTLHRAIDLTPDPLRALALCRDLGIGRVLSSGGAAGALQGLARLSGMQRAAQGVVIMPGGGITAENVSVLAANIDLGEVHASCSGVLPPPAHPGVQAFGFQPAGMKFTDAARVAALRAALDQIPA